MLDGKNENEIDSSMARILVEDDWSDGLTSRYVRVESLSHSHSTSLSLLLLCLFLIIPKQTSICYLHSNASHLIKLKKGCECKVQLAQEQVCVQRGGNGAGMRDTLGLGSL